jgi:hypothetical protein
LFIILRGGVETLVDKNTINGADKREGRNGREKKQIDIHLLEMPVIKARVKVSATARPSTIGKDNLTYLYNLQTSPYLRRDLRVKRRRIGCVLPLILSVIRCHERGWCRTTCVDMKGTLGESKDEGHSPAILTVSTTIALKIQTFVIERRDQ